MKIVYICIYSALTGIIYHFSTLTYWYYNTNM